MIVSILILMHMFVANHCQGLANATGDLLLSLDLTNITQFTADYDKSYSITFTCPGDAKWTTPITPNSFSQIDNSTQIQIHIPYQNSERRLQLRGYYRCCQSDTAMKTVWDEQPNCCPNCCPWFESHKCETIHQPHCTALFLYTDTAPIQKQTNTEYAFEEMDFLVPCFAKRPGAFLKIVNRVYKTLYTTSDGEIGNSMKYRPENGLCLSDGTPTEYLKNKLSGVKCIYEPGGYSYTFRVKYSSWANRPFRNSILILNEAGNYSPLSEAENNILTNHSIKLKCQAEMHLHYDPTYPPQLILFKWKRFYSNSNSEETKYVRKILNQSKRKFTQYDTFEYQVENDLKSLSCITRLPNSPQLGIEDYDVNYPITIFSEEFFGQNASTNEKIFYIDSDNEYSIVEVPFRHSFDYYLVNCTMGANSVVTNQSPCRFNVSTSYFSDKKEVLLHLFERNASISVSYSIELHVLSLPTIHGLDSLVNQPQTIECRSRVTPPYWIELCVQELNDSLPTCQSRNNSKIFTYHPTSNYICVTCQAHNNLGSKKSEKLCIDLYDINLNQQYKVQIVNFHSQGLTIKNATFAAVEENMSLEFWCVWKKWFKNEKQSIGHVYLTKDDEKLLSSTAFYSISTNSTDTTYRIMFRTEHASVNMSGTFACRSNHTELYKGQNLSSLTVKVIHFESPRILYPKPQYEKVGIMGDELALVCESTARPLPNLTLYKINENKIVETKNVSYSILLDNMYRLRQQNSTRLIYKIKEVMEDDFGAYICSANNGLRSTEVEFTVIVPTTKGIWIGVVILVIISLVLILLIMNKFCRRKTLPNITIIPNENELYRLSNRTGAIQLWINAEEQARWMLSPSTVVKHDQIGGGNYGDVFLGTYYRYQEQPQKVAIKQALVGGRGRHISGLDASERNALILSCFRNEVKMLAKLSGTQNIVNMIGCVLIDIENRFEDDQSTIGTLRRPPQHQLWMVMEFCSRGSIQDYIKQHADTFSAFGTHNVFIPSDPTYTTMLANSELTLIDLCRFARGVANGLTFLASYQVIHRDLATRNILLDSRMTPKICDFGLAVRASENIDGEVEYEILSYNKELPFKLMAPECLETQRFLLSSDIWSFGLLLWQMFHLEKRHPFSDIVSVVELRRLLNQHGCFLDYPELAPIEMKNIMSNCWNIDPYSRPTPGQICQRLDQLISIMEREQQHLSLTDNQVDSQRSTILSSVGGSSLPQSPTNNNSSSWTYPASDMLHEDNYGVCSSLVPLLNNPDAGDTSHHTYINQQKLSLSQPN